MNRRNLFRLLTGAAIAPFVPSLPAVALPVALQTARKLVTGAGVSFNNPLVMPAEMTEILREGLNDVFSKAYSHKSYATAFAIVADGTEHDLELLQEINRVHDRMTRELLDSMELTSNPRMEIDHDT